MLKSGEGFVVPADYNPLVACHKFLLFRLMCEYGGDTIKII